jgi:Na+/H+ antiporter NhaD/arsenite permease-like protein
VIIVEPAIDVGPTRTEDTPMTAPLADAVSAVHPIFGLPAVPLAAGIFLLTYAVILTERVNRALVALIGAGLLIVFRVMAQDEAVAAIDFNTLGLLLGMMVIVTITKETGLFQYMALKAAQVVNAEPVALLVMLTTITAVCSAFLDNVTTVLLITPVTLSLTTMLRIDPWPYLIGAIFSSNIGGTATLIGDPPNIMIGSATGLGFNDFIWHLTPVILVVQIATVALLILIWRKLLVASPEARAEVMAMNPDDVLEDRRLLTNCLAVIALVVVSFMLHAYTHLEVASVAIGGAVLLLLLETVNHSSETQHHKVQSAVAEAEWVTLLFFVGLFVVVHGLVKVGVIDQLAQWLLSLTGGHLYTTSIAVLWGSAFLSAIVDNIPYVATMIPLLKAMAPQMGTPEQTEVLWWALAAGACLGGNGTLVGASANLVVAGLAAKQSIMIGFVRYLKVGLPLMVVSMVICHAYVWLRYF